MYTLKSTYLDIKNDKKLGKFFPHLCEYIKENQLKCTIFDPSHVWPLKDAIKSLNYISKLHDENALFYKEFSVDVSMLMLKQKKLSKIAIVLAGGGLGCVCTLPEALPIATYLHKKGFTTLTFNYGVKDKAYHNLAYLDLINLLKYLEKNQKRLNIDLNNYQIYGFSASGHIVSQLGTSNHGYLLHKVYKPGLIGLGYPVISMKEATSESGTKLNLLGKNPSLSEINEYSSELNIDKNYPKTFIWHCINDPVVASKNSYLLSEALTKNKVKHKFIPYKGNVHGWGIATGKEAEGWLDECLKFYKNN